MGPIRVMLRGLPFVNSGIQSKMSRRWALNSCSAQKRGRCLTRLALNGILGLRWILSETMDWSASKGQKWSNMRSLSAVSAGDVLHQENHRFRRIVSAGFIRR
jgi:hypothetical protein